MPCASINVSHAVFPLLLIASSLSVWKTSHSSAGEILEMHVIFEEVHHVLYIVLSDSKQVSCCRNELSEGNIDNGTFAVADCSHESVFLMCDCDGVVRLYCFNGPPAHSRDSNARGAGFSVGVFHCLLEGVEHFVALPFVVEDLPVFSCCGCPVSLENFPFCH
mgnify:CR=1 FL=1